MTLATRRIARLFAVGFLLVFPAGALAQDSATQVTLKPGKLDRQFTHLPLQLTCTAAPAGASACQVAVRGSWSLISQDTGRHQTDPKVFATLPESIPVGTTAAIDLDLEAIGLRDKVVATNGKSAALVDVDVLDGAGAQIDFGSVVGYLPPFRSTCHQPRSFSFTGGPAKQEALDGKGYEPVVSDQLDTSTDTLVGAKGLAFSLYGVTYTFGPNSQFALLCSSLTDYAHGKAFPTVYMRKGSVRVTGKPRSFEYVASIFTPEGSLGSRSQETVDFKVTRDLAKRKSTLRVKRGKTTQITPVNSSTRSPCTNGQGLSVDRHGRISKLR